MIRNPETRQLIIEKTAAIFNKQGYAGTHLSDLTKATGLTKGSIYGNFENKQEVAVAVFRYNYERLRSEITASLQKHAHPVDKLAALIDYYLHNFESLFENGGCPLINTGADADDTNLELRNEVTESILQWKNALIRLIDYGIEKKEMKAVNAETLAFKIIATIQGNVFLAKTLGDIQGLHENLETLKKEILDLKT